MDKIVAAYQERKGVDKYAHVASRKEIEENDYNLNIPRYVDTFEPEEPIDLDAVFKELAEVDEQIDKSWAEFNEMRKQLVWTDQADKGDSNDK